MKTLLAVFVSLLLSSTAYAQSIDKAYQKEFAYLQAQKSALESRVQSLQNEGAAQERNAQVELGGLQNRLVGLQLEGDALQEQLSELERDAMISGEHTDSLLAVFDQASASLERYDVEVKAPEGAVTPQALQAVFESALPVIEEAAQVRTEPGEFFLADGRLTKGDVKYVGRVAAFGTTAGTHVPLAPAGDGHLKVWQGAQPGGIFLFESVDKAIEEKVEQTWLDTIEAGGLIAWVIVGLGALAALLIVWRMLILVMVRRPDAALDEMYTLIARGRYVEARRIAQAASGATARVVARTVEVLKEERSVIEDAVAQAILDEQPAVDRFGTAIMVFAAVAPLLGLLGTVTGMIATFDIITEYGTGDPKMLSGGISEALITTQLGLMVAIPTLLIGNLLNAIAGSVVDGFEKAALRVLNAANREAPPSPARPELVVEVGMAESTA